tara:strand:+ start:375 stop:527 length:153 start_codon:yes stop_codon:yes gene_type:complete
MANVKSEKGSVVVFGLGLGGVHPLGHPERCVAMFLLVDLCCLGLRVLEAL